MVAKLATKDDVTDAVHTLTAQMKQRFGKVDEQLLTVNTKLDAIMSGEVLVT